MAYRSRHLARQESGVIDAEQGAAPNATLSGSIRRRDRGSFASSGPSAGLQEAEAHLQRHLAAVGAKSPSTSVNAAAGSPISGAVESGNKMPQLASTTTPSPGARDRQKSVHLPSFPELKHTDSTMSPTKLRQVSKTPDPSSSGRAPLPALRSPQQKRGSTAEVLMVGSMKGTSGQLARPLASGLRIATNYASFEELAVRGCFDTNDVSPITHEQVDALYDAKCRDQQCPSNDERRIRFHTMMAEACKGSCFVLRQAGLGPESVQSISTMLATNEAITHLDLSGNNVGLFGAQALAQLARTNEALCVLRLQSANLGDGARVLAAALESNQTITALDLSGIHGVHRNNIWGPGVTALAKMLEHNPVLAHLEVGSCGLQAGLVEMLNGAMRSPALTHLGLSSNGVGDEGCAALQQFFSEGHPPMMRSLDLRSNGIGPRGLSRLANGLTSGGKPASNLQVLNLSDNKLRAAALADLATVLQTNENFRSLILSNNTLSNMGQDVDGFKLPHSTETLGALFAALSHAKCRLSKLVLHKCGLTSLPYKEVKSGLANPTCCLTHLDVSENLIGDSGLKAIGDSLSTNEKLVTLKAVRCGGATPGVAAIAKGVTNHARMQRLLIAQGPDLDIKASGIVDACLTLPSLEQTDLPSAVMPEVDAHIAANHKRKVEEAGPQLVEASRTTYAQERALAITTDQILGEMKACERVVEVHRTRKDRYQGQVAAMAAQLQELSEERERRQLLVDTKTVQQRTEEEDVDNKRQFMETATARLEHRLEREIQHRQTIMTKCAEILQKHYATVPISAVPPPTFVVIKQRRGEDGVMERRCQVPTGVSGGTGGGSGMPGRQGTVMSLAASTMEKSTNDANGDPIERQPSAADAGVPKGARDSIVEALEKELEDARMAADLAKRKYDDVAAHFNVGGGASVGGPTGKHESKKQDELGAGHSRSRRKSSTHSKKVTAKKA